MKGFLKCDAPGCDHLEDAPLGLHEGLVDKPCPKCGANLLTRQDYDDWTQRVMPQIEAMKALGLIKDVDDEAPAGRRVTFGVHAGQLNVSGPLPDNG